MQIISRSDAIITGLKKYYTGKPCKNGEKSERLTSSGHCLCFLCVEKTNHRKRARHALNKEKENARAKKWKSDNRDKISEYMKEYRTTENSRQAQRKWYANNSEKKKSVNKRWAEKNKPLIKAISARYRAKKLQATVSFNQEIDDLVMMEAADLCIIRKEQTGIDWEIDHMIPLQAKNVCGLHTFNNIQVIPASLNASKGNRLIMVNVGEWPALL